MEEGSNFTNTSRVEIEFALDSVVCLKVYPELKGIIKDVEVSLRSGVVTYIVGFADKEERRFASELELVSASNPQDINLSKLLASGYEA